MKQDLTPGDRLVPPFDRSAAWPDGRRPPPRFPWLRRIAGAIAILLVTGGVVAGFVGWSAYRHFSEGLPDVAGLKSYQPPVMSRVYAADGTLMAELATERRVFAPYSAIPELVRNAFIAAEDQNFWTHRGIDPAAILRAGVTDVLQYRHGRRPIGASTITQQVAKNMLLGNELTFARKAREALLALRIESVLSKQRILEIYLNQIYLGEQSYGVAAAAESYFGKTLDQLTPADAAFLAALPKAPNNYNPYRFAPAALARRDWVLDRMADDGAISRQAAADGKQQPIIAADFVRPQMVQASSYFAEDVRRQLVAQFGAAATVQNGFTVRTSLDPRLQMIAERVVHAGLVAFDRSHGGWRGAVTHLDGIGDPSWQGALAGVAAPGGMLGNWTLGVVLNATSSTATVGTLYHPPQVGAGRNVVQPRQYTLALADLAWARPVRDGHMGGTPRHVTDVVQQGDVVMVEPPAEVPAAGETARAQLRQIPRVQAGLVSLDPRTGRVLALAGGWSFGSSQFDRVTQAARQPGSSFKPFVYLTAMQQNILPTQTFLDAPFMLNTPQGQWRPQDYESGFEGPVELRTALEKSLNLVTIRVAEHVGMDNVAANAIALHVVDQMPHYLTASIGAVESTILRMAGAYAGLDENGREVAPTLIDSVQDRTGQVVWRAAPVGCNGCDGTDPAVPPLVNDTRRQVADPQSTYQVVQMMQGVVQRGTGVPAGQNLGRPIAGKTGTTQDYNDAWFIGFTPDLVTAVWFGYDTPQALGEAETGGKVAAPVFHDFMQEALAGRPALSFSPPEGMQMVANPAGGQDAFKGDEEPTSQVQLMGEGADIAAQPATDPNAVPGQPAAASSAIDSNVGGVY